MSTEQLVANYTPVGDGISILTGLVLLFIVARVLYFSKDIKFLYLRRALHLIIAGSTANILFDIVVLHFPQHIIAIYALRYLYHLSFMLCLYSFIRYMKEMLDIKGKYVTTFSHITRFVFGAAILMDALAPVTGFGLHYEDGLWSDPLISHYNAVYVYSVLLLFVMLVVYKKRLIRSVRMCLGASLILILIVMVYQGIRNINSLTSFTYIMPILVMMILLHSKPFDDKTGALGLSSLESFIRQYASTGKLVDYLVLNLGMSDLDSIPAELGKLLNSFWYNTFRLATLFNIDFETFVLAIPKNKANGDVYAKVVNLTGDRFSKYYSQYQIPYKVIGLLDCDFIQSEADFIGVLKYMLATMDDNSIVYPDDKKRDELRSLKYIRENLDDITKKEDLDDPRVLVYCQPIRNLRTNRFDTAEALMRLTLPEKGFIMPFMFIPIAERYRNIHTLTKIMLNKVCKQVKELESEGYDFKRVSVNFTASDIMADNFVEDVLGIIRRNGINPAKIGIELTESQNENDFVIVKSKIEELRKEGMTVYLDDIGTGYSNLDRIVRYDVDVVKFDRFFLLEAEKDAKVGKMMRHLSEAFRDLNYKLLYEGVETEENEQLCAECGADYIQGFKYSKPLPMEQMRDFFEKKTE